MYSTSDESICAKPESGVVMRTLRSPHSHSGRIRFPKEANPAHRPRAWLWLEVEHRAACHKIERHRNVHVHDQPLATDLAQARGPTQPEIGLLPSGQGDARPVEAAGEGHVIAHRDGQVSNFIAHRTLEQRPSL